jgi:hypothetical protein
MSGIASEADVEQRALALMRQRDMNEVKYLHLPFDK